VKNRRENYPAVHELVSNMPGISQHFLNPGAFQYNHCFTQYLGYERLGRHNI
jgi:hypothetical protein